MRSRVMTKSSDAPQSAAATLGAPFIDLLPISGVAISAIDHSGAGLSLFSSSSLASQLEELQLDLGEGPLIDAFSRGEPVFTHEHETRWPMFLAAIEPLDVATVCVFPILIGAVSIGTAVTYRRSAGTLSEAAMRTGASLGRAIARPALTRALWLANEEDVSVLNSGSANSREVHQATGMVLAQLDISATDAFARIRAFAFSTGMSVRQIAEGVVANRIDFATVED
jgi:hypothetical protein